VLQNVTKFELLHSSNIEKHKQNAVALANRLGQFVGDQRMVELPLPVLPFSE
jgi:hypothetical protein